MNDMFNDEELAHAEIVQKETEEALGFWKERALKAEAKLADKYLIEEQYEAACGDRDGLLRMVETLRGQKDRLEAERDATLSCARETEDVAVREALVVANEALARYDHCKGYEADEYAMACMEPLRDLLSALLSPAPAPSAKETRT